MTAAYARRWCCRKLPVPLPPIVRDSLDEALRVADTLPPAEGAALSQAARTAFVPAVRAVLTGVGILWLATGMLISIGARRAAARMAGK